jgi:hypothetical protein
MLALERHTARMSHVVVPHLPFPYAGNRFPDNLGAVAQRTVVNGTEPVRNVVHDADGSWLVGDGVNDPNLPGSCLVVALVHLVQDDPSIGQLATMQPGNQAWRDSAWHAWQIKPFTYED